MKLIKKQISNLTYFSIDNLSISLDASKRYDINLWSEGTQKQGNYTKTLYFDDTLEEWRMRDCECSNKNKSLDFSIVIENNVLKSLETLKIYGIDNGGVHIFNEVYFELNEIGGGGSDITLPLDYQDDIANKPSINNVELSGNKTNVDLGIELKIITGVTTYASGVVAPTINVNDFNSILTTNAPTITIISHTGDDKTHNYKVSYKTTSGIDNKPTFIITGIDNNTQINYAYYLSDNSTVAVKFIQDVDVETFITHINDFNNLVLDFTSVKNGYVDSIAWSGANLYFTQGDGTTTPIMRNAHIYRHYYTIRPTSAYVYETISFIIDLPTPTPLTTNTLRAWFTASPFWDTNGANYVGKPLYPCNGIASQSSSQIPYVYPTTGLCYFVEQDGMILNVTLRAYCNYGASFNLDESTLHCSGVYNLTNGEWE